MEAIIFPQKSVALKMAIKITGIHEPNLHDIISDSMPGNNANVTKYAIVMDDMYGNINFDTFMREMSPHLILFNPFSQKFLQI